MIRPSRTIPGPAVPVVLEMVGIALGLAVWLVFTLACLPP